MSDSAKIAFERAVILTKSMSDAIQQNRIDDLVALDNERTNCFKICLPLPAELQTEAIQQSLQKMISLNEQLEASCQDAKHILVKEIESFNGKSKAIKAYQSS